MAKTGTAKAALPYIQRVLEDEFVQEQLRNAALGARAAYVRARRQRSQAADDKALYRNLRQAATSLRNATIALQRPEPPPKRRIRKTAAVGLAIGGCVWLTMKLQKLQSGAESDANVPATRDSGYASSVTGREPAGAPAAA